MASWGLQPSPTVRFPLWDRMDNGIGDRGDDMGRLEWGKLYKGNLEWCWIVILSGVGNLV